MALLAVRLGTSLCLGSTRDPCMLCHVFNLIKKKIQSSFKLRSFDAREPDWKSFSESYAQNFLDFDLQIKFLTARYLPVNRFINHLDSILSPTHVRVDFAFAYCNRPTYSWRIGLLTGSSKQNSGNPKDVCWNWHVLLGVFFLILNQIVFLQF